jgi:hypothetical protein
MKMTEIDHYRTFAASEYGHELEQKTRFDTFKPDFVDTRTWTGLLGDDVNNLYHMSHTHQIAKKFAMYEGMREYATHVLLTTAITHDWGEAKIGDIPLPDKTAEDESQEEIAYREIANELYGGVQGKSLSDTVWKVLSHEDEDMGDRFRAIEYIGYCTTAMRAGLVATRLSHGLQHVEADRTDTNRLIGGLFSLEKAVQVHNYPTLAKYVEKYPSIEDQLKDMKL